MLSVHHDFKNHNQNALVPPISTCGVVASYNGTTPLNMQGSYILNISYEWAFNDMGNSS